MAAEQGDARAQYNLGNMYVKGQGVAQDYIQANAWFNLASSMLAELASEKRELISNLMTPDQIAEAQKLAREWAVKYNQ